MPTQWFIIANPHSGGGKGKKQWPDVARNLEKAGISFRHSFSKYPGHATTLAREAVENGFTHILGIGGDGTVNEIINGIFQQSIIPTQKIVFGLIPVGSGNDWARTYKIPANFQKVIGMLKAYRTFTQDIGLVTFMKDGIEKKRYFNNVAGLAFDAYLVDKTVNMNKNGWKGQLVYIWALLKYLRKYKGTCLEIQSRNFSINKDALTVNIGICKYSGGGMRVVPDAIPDDGLFDITFIEKISPFQVLRHILKLYNGTIYRHPKAHFFQTTQFEVSSHPGSKLEVDGEPLGSVPAHFEILPKALQVVIP